MTGIHAWFQSIGALKNCLFLLQQINVRILAGKLIDHLNNQQYQPTIIINRPFIFYLNTFYSKIKTWM
jgi:hypothetical protein